VEFAADWTGEARKACPADGEIARQRAEALLLSGNTAEAFAAWSKVTNRDDRGEAALVICAILSNRPASRPTGERETILSQEFLKWYRQFLNWGLGGLVSEMNGRLDHIERFLPTAGGMLRAALAEAEAELTAAD
jgi:hypothetical protein